MTSDTHTASPRVEAARYATRQTAGAPQVDPDTLLSKVRAAQSITEYISRHVVLKQGGTGESSGQCPFHDDNHPSMTVSEGKGVFHCKGCGATGNVVHFHARINEMEYVDALKSMAKTLGIYRDAALPAPLRLLESMSKRYQEALPGQSSAVDYLASRQLSEETQRRFGVGYCSGDELLRAGPTYRDEAVAAGVLTKSSTEGGRPYNQMAKRVVFTIRDSKGRAVGFGGRALDSTRSGPKYLNTQETEYFKKSELLFGLYEARGGIFRAKHVVLVEGYFDAAILHQAGIDNTVAVMGASTSDAAYASLWNITDRLVFCLDGDVAGRAGTLRSVLHAAALMTDGRRIDIVSMPQGMDPDEYVLANGADAFRKLCDDAMPLSQYLSECTLASEEETNGRFNLRVAENRARYLTLMREVASKFLTAPALQLEIQRDANAVVNAYVIASALRMRSIDASPEEIQTALAMVLSLPRAPAAPVVEAPVVEAAILPPARPEYRARPVMVTAPAPVRAVPTVGSSVPDVCEPAVESEPSRRTSLFKRGPG